MTPKLSIIVPVYNAEAYINECVDSILNQTFQDFEILLVDDGSRDGSAAIADKYAASFPDKIRVFHKPNGGASSARNLGLDNARGKYIGFVDSDDIILPDMYRTLIDELEFNHVSVVTSCLAEWDLGYRFKGEKTPGKHSFRFLLKQILSWNEGTDVYTKLFRREVIGDLRFKEGLINEDFRFLCEVFLKEGDVLVTDHKFYKYRITPGSVTSEVNPKFFDLFANLDYIESLVPPEDKSLMDAFQRYTLTIHIMSGVRIVRSKLNKKYKDWLRKNRNFVLKSWKNLLLDTGLSMRWRAKAVFIFLRLPVKI